MIAHVDNAVTSRVGRAPLKVTVGFAVSDGEHFNDEFMTRVDFVRNGKVEYSRSVTDSQAAALAATTGDELGVISYRIPVGKESGRWSIHITTPFDQWSQPVTITRNPSKPGKPRPASTPVRVSTPITPTPEMALATITTITTSRDAAGRAQIAIAGMNTRLLVSVLFLPADLRVPNIAGKYCTYKEAVADPVGCTLTFTSQAAGSSEATVYINAIAGNLQRQETVTFPRLRN